MLHITHAGPYNPDGFPLTIGDEVTVGHKVTAAPWATEFWWAWARS